MRSQLSRERHVQRGARAEIVDLPEPPLRSIKRVPVGRTVLLAGLAAARNGVFEAVEATRRLGVTLLVRDGEGAERGLLSTHQHVHVASTMEREQLAGVCAVLAPGWCEAHHPEIALAARIGVPVIATDRAAGLVDLGTSGWQVQPGEVAAIVEALSRLRRSAA